MSTLFLNRWLFSWIFEGFSSCIFDGISWIMVPSVTNLHNKFLKRSFYFNDDWLTLPVPCISESCIEIKIKLNFYFHTSLLCLKDFILNLLRHHKEVKTKIYLNFFSLRLGLGWEGLKATLNKFWINIVHLTKIQQKTSKCIENCIEIGRHYWRQQKFGWQFFILFFRKYI